MPTACNPFRPVAVESAPEHCRYYCAGLCAIGDDLLLIGGLKPLPTGTYSHELDPESYQAAQLFDAESSSWRVLSAETAVVRRQFQPASPPPALALVNKPLC
jgi:hypothetical protein